MIHWTVLNVNEKSIRNLDEKPAQLFIGKTIEKTGSDTLITLSASEPVICCYRFFRLPLPRLLPGDFSIYPGVDFNDKPSLIRYNTNQSIFAHYGMRGRFSMEANVINELQNGLRRINWRVLSGCRRILHWSTRFVNKCELEKFMTEYGGGRRCPTYCTTGR